MEQDTMGVNNTTNIPGNLPGEREQANNIEQAGALPTEKTDELLKEQAKEPAPSGPTAPGKGEDVVLFVETINVSEQPMERSPEDVILGGIDLEIGVPWYRSRWMYVGAGLVAATALSIGAVLLLRGRTRHNRRLTVSRTIMKPIKQSRRRRPLPQAASRMQGRFSRWGSQLSGQASSLTGQAQGQLSRLTHRTRGAAATLNSFQRQRNARTLLNRTRWQFAQLPTQASGQLRSLRTITRTRATQAINGTQENLAQLGRSVTSGVAKTGARLKRSWKLGRTFTLGAGAGALWAMLYTPQGGEATRQRLMQPFQSRLKQD